MAYMEIMAPAGGREQLVAAIRAGADSVYLGTKGFNARRNAENFDGDGLCETVSFCHARDAKVYVTVNTMVLGRELEKLEEELDMIARSGADAVIVQDMAVLRLLRQKYPTIKRYASTQTAVHNSDGAKQLQDLGFDSVVLARELELREMEKIASSVSIKCEAFVHGAHCMSLSGACYLSAMLGGRSGNRGLCAQPCRLDARCAGHSYALSLKDMSLISHMREMSEAGVNSFKIEGRMKRPEYVACAVASCVASRDGREYDAETLRAVFSRSGFTDGYLTGKRDHRMFGRRTQEDAGESESVLGKIRELYRIERPRVSFDAELTLLPGVPARLTVTADDLSAEAEGPAPESPRTRATEQADAERAIGKTGGTPFRPGEISLINPAGLILPPAAIGDMRRRALESLLEQKGRVVPHEMHERARTAYAAHHPPEKPAYFGMFREESQIARAEAYARIILPIGKITEDTAKKYGEKLVAALPAALFPRDEDALRPEIDRVKALGVSSVYTENIYGIRLAKEAGLEVIGGPCLNIANSEALLEYENAGLAMATLSFELPMNGAKRIEGALPRGILAYGRVPVMRLRACPGRSDRGCGSCAGNPVLTDRKNVEFPILCEDRRYSTMYNSVPIDISGRDLRGFDFCLLSFTMESREECARIVDAFVHGERPEEPHTTGLYFKELM